MLIRSFAVLRDVFSLAFSLSFHGIHGVSIVFWEVNVRVPGEGGGEGRRFVHIYDRSFCVVFVCLEIATQMRLKKTGA